MPDALSVTRSAAWFTHYAPGHWSLNLVNIHPGLPEPYTISKVKGGYTATLAGEKVGNWQGFEDAIVGCWQHMDADCAAQLKKGGFKFHSSTRSR